MPTTTTKVRCKVVSKKDSESYIKEHPIATQIELQVPYDVNSVFYQMSGGTSFLLNTVNKEAADMFKIGQFYDVLISPSVD